ncbi:glutamate--tRNA ligase [Rhodospirillaceae bacterium KN72]|uniref:Glutamate--tRNA ligase n=1 Tax=Pacificispira spongiicola TaxID=2729598 RepID=A0A7Y0DYN6_9PROT|nr:glutamate--tRNA ligase [Pacificispira spongiicola]NMM44022.1 glutamate--tRNA ligase [Pacificispira spongiicola]
MTVVTRFAPSPTGFLHIGGARTALFNYLYARHHGGTYKLRIEDTDRKRSTQEAIDAIMDGLSWLGLNGDGDILFQSSRADRHAEVAKALLDSGHAYRCYCSPEELEAMRGTMKEEGRKTPYNGYWRDRDPSEAPAGVDPVIRIKMPRDGGATTIKDLVQGDVTIENDQLDDFILLRADGTPTYMLSVVVDDHDMGVTHVIRGDDHLVNAFRQFHLFKAAGWDVPAFAHIPLIHGPDGAKLSKRHGALGVEQYREMGYLPETLKNYLLRLGWSHGDEEIISENQAIEWFDLDAVGRSPSRMDFQRLENLNGHYLREADPGRLADMIAPALGVDGDEGLKARLAAGMPGLTQRANTIPQLVDAARFYVERPRFPLENPKAAKLVAGEGPAVAKDFAETVLAGIENWTEATLHDALKNYVESKGIGFGKIGQPVRGALTGTNASPDLAQVMAVLGREETLARIDALPLNA